MKQCKGWTGARFAVRYPGSIVVVVEPESHVPGRATSSQPQAVLMEQAAFLSLRREGCAIPAQPAAIFANVSEMQVWTK
jgi:hypothetical protein